VVSSVSLETSGSIIHVAMYIVSGSRLPRDCCTSAACSSAGERSNAELDVAAAAEEEDGLRSILATASRRVDLVWRSMWYMRMRFERASTEGTRKQRTK
jgi:hypothetical protein